MPFDKSSVPIGIFGSFRYGRIDNLRTLRNFLNSNEYFAQITEDIDPHFNDLSFQKPIGYDLKISEQLIHQSSIHIFVFNIEGESEHQTSTSPAIELTILRERIRSGQILNPKLLLYYENGCEDGVGSLLRDLLLSRRYWREFNYTVLKEICEDALMKCYDFIATEI